MTTRSDLPVWRTRAARLGCVPVLAILLLVAVSKTESRPGYVQNNAPTPEGSWLVTVTLDLPGGPSFPSLVSYTAGGVVIVSDTGVYPTYPMTTAYHGTWANKTGRDFVFSFVGFQYDNVDDGYLDGLWKFTNKETVTIDPGGDTYTGSSTITWEDPEGTIFPSIAATTHGTRIKPE